MNKRRYYPVGLAIILFFIVSLGVSADRTRDLKQTLEFGGRTRSYLVHLPPNYTKRERLPLVLVLHGGGGNAKSNIELTGFSDKADKEHFIVVYPNGTGRLDNILLTWNSGNCCGYALDNKIDDTGFLSALIDKMEREFNIDTKRVYATGLSNGGMMSYRLGCELADKIAAIAPVAGALNLECRPSQPVSVIAFHGTDDQHVLYEGGKPRKKADPHDRTDNSVANAIAFWVGHNQCASQPVREQMGNIIVDTYQGGRNNSEVVLYTINGGTHSWPGGKKPRFLADEPTQEISATDLMWDFFLRHPKR